MKIGYEMALPGLMARGYERRRREEERSERLSSGLFFLGSLASPFFLFPPLAYSFAHSLRLVVVVVGSPVGLMCASQLSRLRGPRTCVRPCKCGRGGQGTQACFMVSKDIKRNNGRTNFSINGSNKGGEADAP